MPQFLHHYCFTSTFLACHEDRVDDWHFKVKDGLITDGLIGDYDAWQNCGVSSWNEADGKRLSVQLTEAYEALGEKELFWG